jgi:Flp pilus assembly protein TadG
MIWFLHNLKSDRRGAAVIELAMVAPVLAIAVVGVVDMSNAYSRKLALEQGAQRAIEKIMQTTEDSTVRDTLITEAVCQVNGLNANGTCKTTPITATNVTVNYIAECKNAGGTIVNTRTTTSATTFDGYTCGSGETEQNYISVVVTDKYTPMFPVRKFGGINADGTYHLSAEAGMRTQ